jgi:hypothetical protein
MYSERLSKLYGCRGKFGSDDHECASFWTPHDPGCAAPVITRGGSPASKPDHHERVEPVGFHHQRGAAPVGLGDCGCIAPVALGDHKWVPVTSSINNPHVVPNSKTLRKKLVRGLTIRPK